MARCYICNYCDTIDDLGVQREGRRLRKISFDSKGREVCNVCKNNGMIHIERAPDPKRAKRKSLEDWANAILKGEIIENDDTKNEE